MARNFPNLAQEVATEKRLPTWIAHIYQRLHRHHRLGLILGAGVSVDAGCPSWQELVQRLSLNLSAAKNMKSYRTKGLAETYLTQILYHRHKTKELAKHSSLADVFQAYQVESAWIERVHSALYEKNIATDFNDLAKVHPYLHEMGELVSKADITVNFNFDDIVDEAAIKYCEKVQKSELPEVIWKPKSETRRNAPLIYHINGYLPREKVRRRSESIVLTEDAFAEMLLSTDTAEIEFISSRFSNTTFLLCGTSLADNSLKNMLRLGAKRNPANHHYIIYWESPTKPRSMNEKTDIFQVNLEVYNLISMFLTSSGMKELFTLINDQNESNFEEDVLALSGEDLRRRYHLVGAVTAGKTTNLEALRCFTTHEEWTGRPPALLYQDHNSLTPDERKTVNAFIYAEMREKNRKMTGAPAGNSIMDRAYLDLFAFSKDDKENLDKALELQQAMKANIQGAHILFLDADSKNFEMRLAKRGKLSGRNKRISYNARGLIEQARNLKQLYSPDANSIFRTDFDEEGQTARKIARFILLETTYKPFNFGDRLSRVIANNGSL